MNQRLLFAILGLLVALAIVVYGWGIFSRQRQESPQALAQTALSASDPATKQLAAAKLAGLSATPTLDYSPVAQSPAAPVEVQQEVVRVLKESKEPAVRAVMIQSVANSYDYDSMPLVLDALEDKDPVVFGRAWAAATRMLGVRIDFRPDDSPQQHAKKIQAARDIWKSLEHSPRQARWKKRVAEMQQQGQ